MSMPVLTPDQIEQYFSIRLDSYKLRHSKGTQYRAMCPLHGGSTASQLLVDFADGHFHCFTCNKGGRKSKLYFFEMEMLKLELGRAPSHDETQASIERILGEPVKKQVYRQAQSEVKEGGFDLSQAAAHYVYQDETGEEVLSTHRIVFRNGQKIVTPDRPCPFCKANLNPDAECPWKCQKGRIQSITPREDGLPGVRRVLYRLPDLMASTLCFVCEGEKNVDDLSKHFGMYIKRNGGFEFGSLMLDRVAVVTNQGGALAWKKEYGYARDFWRKTVIVLRDNDAPGVIHRNSVCEDIAQQAREVYTLELPDMGPGEDISDYLLNHTIEDFLNLLPQRKLYETPARKYLLQTKEDQERTVLVKPSKLLKPGKNEERDWLVPGLIARGRRGLVVAAPKVGKSLLFCDLALCLGTNRGFLGAKPYGKPVRTALISREDEADELYFRLKVLGAGRGLTWEEIDQNISVNTREQTAHFNINNEQHRVEMAEWLKAEGTEFAVFDVLNKITAGADANSSTDMTRTMLNFDDLAHSSGAQITVIHHSNKSGGTMGNTAIEGWADFIIKLEANPDDESLKMLLLRTKSSSLVPPKTLKYYQSDDQKESRIQLVEARPVAVPSPSRPRLVARTGTEPVPSYFND